jgi:hypothetical protein
VIYLRTGSYESVTPQALREKNDDLQFVVDGASTGPEVVSMKVVAPRHFRIAVHGAGTCWGVREEGRQNNVATLYAKRPGPTSECKATSFQDADFREHDAVWR